MGRARRILSVVFALVGVAAARPASGADAERRPRPRVEFLYSIEHAGGRAERLREPIDLFFDRKAQELYVVEAATHRLLVYDRNGMFVQAIVVDGKEGGPKMAAVDGSGRIVVGHLNSARITLLDFRGQLLETISLPGVVDVPGATIRPAALAADARGEVYALKTVGGIVRIDPDRGEHEQIPFVGEARPNAAYGITVDPAGRFLLTDMRPYSVVAFDPRTGSSRRFGTPGVLYGQLDRPIGIAADEAGRSFVVSTVTNKVSIFGPDGEFIDEFGGLGEGYGQFYMPSRIVSDGKDRIYVLENTMKRVQVFRVEFPDGKTP